MKDTLRKIGIFIKKISIIVWNFIKKISIKIARFIRKYICRVENSKLIIFNNFKIKVTIKRREAFFGYLFILIWIVGFAWLTAYPLFSSFRYSFRDVSFPPGEGIKTVKVGLKNFRLIGTDLIFMNYVWDFIIELVMYVPLIIIISLVIALMLNQKIKLRGLFRAIFFLPVIIVSGPVLEELVGQGAGTVGLIERLGILEIIAESLPRRLAVPLTSLFSELIILFWFSGVQIVLFLAGLQKSNSEIYEAAQIDGASSWESFWKITLPSLKNIIAICAIYTIVMLSTISTNPIIVDIKEKMYKSGTELAGYGYASALSWIYAIIVILALALTTLIIIRPKRQQKETYKGWVNVRGR